VCDMAGQSMCWWGVSGQGVGVLFVPGLCIAWLSPGLVRKMRRRFSRVAHDPKKAGWIISG
jgi:hypothetical protein